MTGHEVTQAEAARILGRLGLHRPAAVDVLRCGFAGVPRTVGGGSHHAGKLLYDERKVWDLVVRPVWWASPPGRVLDPGVLVVRSSPRRPSSRSAYGWEGVDLTAPWGQQLEAIRRVRRLAPASCMQIGLASRARGVVPLVVSVGSFVAFGAEVRGLEHEVEQRAARLALVPPGAWFDPLEGGRLISAPGAPVRWLSVDGIADE